jgi:hypothetical protein
MTDLLDVGTQVLGQLRNLVDKADLVSCLINSLNRLLKFDG